MSRGKKSIYNAGAAIMLTISNGIMGLLYTKMILIYFGSDFNGVNATATQIVNMLLLLEGGFTVATNVALFEPYYQKNYFLVNQIIVATQNIFKKIGKLFLIIGLIASGIYAFTVNSNLSHLLIFYVLFVTIIPSAFNLYCTTKYRILLQAEQKEYVISLFSATTITIGYLINILLMHYNGSIYLIRFITMSCSLINSSLIIYYVKKHYRFLNLQVSARPDLILGTRSILIQKLTGVIYSTIPIIFISVTVSSSLASVYAVYNSVFALIKNLLHSIIDAPRFALGELAAIGDKDRLWNAFFKYQLVTISALAALLSTTAALIIPFISLYTSNITDANYKDPTVAILMIWISSFELLHIPSGHLINMSGKFSVSRNIQVSACLGLLFLMLMWGPKRGIYGILSAVLFTAIFLAIFEIGYIHLLYFKNKLFLFLKLSLSLSIVSVLIVSIENIAIQQIHSYFQFIMLGFIILLINSVVIIITLLTLLTQPSIECIKYCFNLLNKRL